MEDQAAGLVEKGGGMKVGASVTWEAADVSVVDAESSDVAMTSDDAVPVGRISLGMLERTLLGM